MAAVKDICRICLRAVHYDEVQEIDLKKLSELIVKFLLPKWEVQLFRDHLICNSCIDNFRTQKILYKLAWKANGLVMRMRQKNSKYAHLKDIDLKRLDMFQELKGDFAVCRLCLEPTKNVAINLCDDANSILPPAYINIMLKCVRLYMMLLDITLKPILCFKCWQRIQISFSFRKHLDLVTERIKRYQEITSENYIDRVALQDVFNMWDKLGPSGVEKLPPRKNHHTPNSSIHSTPTKKKKRPKTMPILTPEYTFFDEHNYFSKRLPNLQIQLPSARDSETESCSSTDEEFEFIATELKKLNVSEKLRSPQVKNKKPINCKKKTTLPSVDNKKNIRKKPLITNGSTHNDNTFIRRTRLSARREIIEEQNSKDLLVLKKEEILKAKPFRNFKPVIAHTSTPKVVPEKSQLTKKTPSKQPINEFTFERLNFDNEVQTDQISLEEVQIKREVISDSDDDFIETPLNIRDGTEQCPNLDVFIKTEPEEIMDVDEDKEEEPPELEFQGPCNYDPQFVISNTFTVNDKRHNTLDEKRNSASENSSKIDNGTFESNSLRSSTVLGKKRVGVASPKSLLDHKKLDTLQLKADSKSSTKPIIRDVVIDLYQCDKKPVQPSKTISPVPTAHIEKKELTNPPFNSSLGGAIIQPKNPKISNLSQVIIPAKKVDRPIDYKNSFPIQPKKYKMIKTSNSKPTMPKLTPVSIIHDENKEEKSWIDKFYSEIGGLVVNQLNPFECQICDFLTISERAAKVHMSSHKSNRTKMYLCKFCPYKTTQIRNLNKHKAHHWIAPNRVRSSSRRCSVIICSVCKSPDAKVYCSSCRKMFDPYCLMTENLYSNGCRHFAVSHCLKIETNGSISLLDITSPNATKCNVCLLPAEKWVECQQCKQFFHYHCFHFSRIKQNTSCHNFIDSRKQTAIENSPNNQKKKKSEQRNCDYCRQTLDSVIPCPMCMKFMHQACYQKDSRQMRFGCKHTDIVGEPPRTETQTTFSSDPKASTSKELKQEMLDLSEFIMLCD